MNMLHNFTSPLLFCYMIRLQKHCSQIKNGVLTVRLISELIGTALLIIFDNGAVANVELKGTKGSRSSLTIIAVGYGFGVMLPALMIGSISAQIIGAIIRQLLVVLAYKPFYDRTDIALNSSEYLVYFVPMYWTLPFTISVSVLPFVSTTLY